MDASVPVVDYLVLDGADGPHLRALVCADCGARFLDHRDRCAGCGGATLTPTRLANHGRVRSWTEVHRAPAGVSAPFISCVVDLDGGGRVKANLVDCPREQITPGMCVTLTTYVAGVDDCGTRAIAFAFTPGEVAR